MPNKPTRTARRPSSAEAAARRINRRFGAAVKAAREAQGLSYRAGAEHLGVSLSHLQELEAGAVATSLPLAWSIAQRLGFRLEAALKG